MLDFLQGAVDVVSQFDPMTQVMDGVGRALGLPPVVTDAVKAAVGACTGNVVLLADGATGVAAALAHAAPAFTEYVPYGGAAAACAGYARPPPSHGGCGPGYAGGVPHGAGEYGGAVGGGSRGAPPDGQLGELERALLTLQAHFDTFDTAAGIGWRDGLVGREDLQAIARSGGASPELRRAAGFLLSHPEYLNRLDTAAGVGFVDGRVGRDDVRAALAQVRAERCATPAPSAPCPPPSPGAGGGCWGPGGAGGIRDILNDPSLSIEEKLQLVLARLMEGTDDQILSTMDELAQAQARKAGLASDDKEGLAQAQRGEELINMRLQKLIERRKQMFELMSNLSEKFNEMAKTAIQNLARA